MVYYVRNSSLIMNFSSTCDAKMAPVTTHPHAWKNLVRPGFNVLGTFLKSPSRAIIY